MHFLMLFALTGICLIVAPIVFVTALAVLNWIGWLIKWSFLTILFPLALFSLYPPLLLVWIAIIAMAIMWSRHTVNRKPRARPSPRYHEIESEETKRIRAFVRGLDFTPRDGHLAG